MLLQKMILRESARLQWSALLLVGLIFSGCASRQNGSAPSSLLNVPADGWPMYQYRATHNAVFQRNQFRVSWSRELGGKVNGALSIVGDILYVTSFDRHVYALDVATGSLRWSAKAGNILMSTPIVANGTVVVGTGESGFLRPNDWRSPVWGRERGDDILAFDSGNGRRRWTFHTQGEDMPSSAIISGKVVFANGDLHAYAVDLRDGKRLWRSSLPGIVSMSSVTLDEDRAFFGTCHNAPHRCATVALDVRTGHVIWQSKEGGSDASPTVDGGLVFVAGDRIGSPRFRPGGHDVIAALDQKSGATRWEYVGDDGPVTLVGSAEHAVAGTVDNGVLYQALNTADEVVALYEHTGKLRWRLRTYAPVKMSPIVAGHRVYFGDSAGLLYVVDSQNGSVLSTSAMKKPFSTAPFVLIGQTLFAANGDDVVAVPVDQLNEVSGKQ